MSDPIQDLNSRFTPEQRKAAAEIIQTNPVLVAAFEAVKHGCYQSWVDSKPDERDERERLFMLAGAANMVQAVVNSVVANGQFDISARDKVRKGQKP